MDISEINAYQLSILKNAFRLIVERVNAPVLDPDGISERVSYIAGICDFVEEIIKPTESE